MPENWGHYGLISTAPTSVRWKFVSKQSLNFKKM